MKIGLNLELKFQFGLHKKDKYLLDLIENYLGVGKIHKDGSDSFKLTVIAIKDLQVVIEHFDKYPLRTQKLADYNLFKQAYNIILKQEHLTFPPPPQANPLSQTPRERIKKLFKEEFSNS